MAVLWSLTCAAATLSLLQENNLSNSMRQGKMSDKSSETSFTVSTNLKNAKNYFIEAKIYKLTELVMP